MIGGVCPARLRLSGSVVQVDGAGALAASGGRGAFRRMTHPPFAGAKIALFLDEAILVYLRDDKPDIPHPNQWDLPGGGREGAEGPLECALRELHEEFAIALAPARIVWMQAYPGHGAEGASTYFFAAHLTAEDVDAISFGDEGQHWELMPVSAFLDHPAGVRHLQDRVRDFLRRDSAM